MVFIVHCLQSLHQGHIICVTQLATFAYPSNSILLFLSSIATKERIAKVLAFYDEWFWRCSTRQLEQK